MGEDRKRQQDAAGGEQQGLPDLPRLPERAAIYISPDGTVHFGALFEGLLPVAEALRAPSVQKGGPPRPEKILSLGSDIAPPSRDPR